MFTHSGKKNTYSSLETKYLHYIVKELTLYMHHIPKRRGVYTQTIKHLTEAWTDIKLFVRSTDTNPSDSEICLMVTKVLKNIAYTLQEKVYTALKKLPCNILDFHTYCEAKKLVLKSEFNLPQDFLQCHNPVSDSKMPKLEEMIVCQTLIDDFVDKMKVFMDLCFGLNARNLLIPISTEENEPLKVSDPSFILGCLHSEPEHSSFPIMFDYEESCVTDIMRVARFTENGSFVSYMCPCPEFREDVDPASNKIHPMPDTERVVIPTVGIKMEKIYNKEDAHYNTADNLAVMHMLENLDTVDNS